MATDSLDQLVDSELIQTTDQAIRTEHRAIGSFAREYPTIDVYAKGTFALYTPPPKPFVPMTSYTLPSGGQLHIHTGGGDGTLGGGGYRIRLNSYESAMSDYYANQLGFPRVDTLCRQKKW